MDQATRRATRVDVLNRLAEHDPDGLTRWVPVPQCERDRRRMEAWRMPPAQGTQEEVMEHRGPDGLRLRNAW